ncbi:hypothetical protein EVAR_61947_1 [Eumeta japonica]|uniref:Uncharacterized protein n=1 Tax=Eumeta variegata TaxID=151549 RepID=A0A4C1ZNZ7_EUMVA|nr:hypothetical protein EVAR_61947_1 [Eumeta japonica]
MAGLCLMNNKPIRGEVTPLSLAAFFLPEWFAPQTSVILSFLNGGGPARPTAAAGPNGSISAGKMAAAPVPPRLLRV